MEWLILINCHSLQYAIYIDKIKDKNVLVVGVKPIHKDVI